MSLLDLLFSAGKAAADYAQKNPYEVGRAFHQIKSHSESNKASTFIDRYYMRKYIKDNTPNAHSFKVTGQDGSNMDIEVYDYRNNLIKRVRCAGDGVSPSYRTGEIYSF